MAQNKKFSVIVPLYKDGFKTLDRFLLCLKEQDYKNFEVIFVHNSPNGEGKKFLHMEDSPTKNFPNQIIELDAGYDKKLGNGNHCRAFNYGAKHASGDYLLFLDPEVYLYPGILREYKNKFEENPDVAFVYGHYDIEGIGRISGRTFSEYELYCANYISGAYPVRKEAFKGWDPEIKSLQDWDMWLSVVDAGGKGLFFEMPCFTTAPPEQGGISHDSATNWLDRYNKVRIKHGRPSSETVVTSLGAPFHATNTAEILGVDSRVHNNIHTTKENDYKNVYLLGFYPEGWDGHMRLFYPLGDLSKDPLPGKKIIHWIGTDIFNMMHKLSWMAVKNITTFLNDKDFNFIHLTEAQHTHDELKELGIDSQIIPLPTKDIRKVSPLPKKFTVGVYINPTQDMYFESFMYEIADAMPDIQFKFFGNNNMKDKVEKNKEWVGWVDMKEFLPTISALVRLTIHDGLPLGPIETMQAGRNVLSSTPLKYALHAKYVGGEPVKEEIVKQIRQLKKMPLNKDGSVYWQEEMSHELFKKRIEKLLK